MLDYHIHSHFSEDCDTPMENTIKKAIELGFKEICFTDHIDYDYPHEDWTFEFDLKEYDKEIKAMQEKYGDQLAIKKGVEIGIQPHLIKRYEKMMSEESFDFVICSMHATEGKEMHYGTFFEGKTVEEAFEIYYKEILSCIKEFKEFSVLGHIDLVKRYAKEKSKDDFHDILREIFEEIIPAGKGIELNTSGYRYGLEAGMPSADILKLYKDCGGEVITIGSDSHVTDTLGFQFQTGLALLKEIGFNYVASFTDGEPEFHAIDRFL